MMDFLLIIVGLVMLFAGGEALVRGSVAISQRLGISSIFIGMVVVGFGTSTPELMVSVSASLAGQPYLALGNVVGSNIANILFILGISTVIFPIVCLEKAIRRDALAVTAASGLLFALTFITDTAGTTGTTVISALTGAMMITALVAYLLFSLKAELGDKAALADAKAGTMHEHEAQEFSHKMGLPASLLLSAAGIAMLVFGADFLVEGASKVALAAGISEAVIGLTLVAVGTSLPELATAISAAIKKNADVIIGNVLGSNLFNILSILGATAIITPVPLGGQIAKFDVPLNLGISLLILFVIFIFGRVSRMIGGLFLLSYAAYIFWLYLS